MTSEESAKLQKMSKMICSIASHTDRAAMKRAYNVAPQVQDTRLRKYARWSHCIAYGMQLELARIQTISDLQANYPTA